MSQTIPSTDIQIRFMDFPSFKPWYRPDECLKMGIFGGAYLYNLSDRQFMDILFKEYNLPATAYRGSIPLAENNHYEILTPLRSRNIPLHGKAIDPKGWFQWYCRFWCGRRTPYDTDRITQFKSEVIDISFPITNGGPSHETQSRFNNQALYLMERQHLLQYGWDSTRNPKDFL